MNSDKLHVDNDMGLDGKAADANENRYVGADGYGWSLGYFGGEYQSIGTSNFLVDRSSAAYLATYGKDLYNGNIGHMITTLPTGTNVDNPDPQLGAYTYDQLNRIKRAQYYQENSFNISGANNALNSGTYSDKYKEKYLYDGNGNILNLWRWDESGAAMDNMAYNYYENGSSTSRHGLDGNYYSNDMTNRLAYVNDAVSGSTPTTDIESGMGSTNYAYDEIGQMIEDASEDIASIEWTVKNKVRKVIRTASSGKDDLEFMYDALGNRVAKIVKPDGKSVENGGTDLPNDWEYTYYTLDAQGNAIAVYTADATNNLTLKEQQVYGSERLETKHRSTVMNSSLISSTEFGHILGNTEYELKNHLGNVLVNVSDLPLPKDDVGSDGITDVFEPNVLTAQDYTPFGTIMGGSRGLNQGDARYGFNKQEQVDEISGNGNHNTALFWEYDTRLGRRWNIDPKPNPTLSLYCVFTNSPIWFSDPLGDTIVLMYDGRILSNDGIGNGVYIRTPGPGTGTKEYIGELGGKIDANKIYANMLEKNIEETSHMWNPNTFRDKVKNKGEWDFKNNKGTIYGLGNDGKTIFLFEGEEMRTEDIGNHHYGATGKAFWLFTEGMLLRGAGDAQMKAGTSKPEWQRYAPGVDENSSDLEKAKTMLPPYGDDPIDQSWIKKGFEYNYNRVLNYIQTLAGADDKIDNKTQKR